MGKMVKKDELEFLRKMASEGNLESKLNKGLGEVVDQGNLPLLPSAAQKNLVRHGSKEVADSVSNKMKQSILSKLASKGLGRAASIAAGPLAFLPDLVEASDIAPSDNTPSEGEMKDAALQMQKESFLEELRNKSNRRASTAMDNQNIERDVKEKLIMDEKIDSMINDGKSDEDLEMEAKRNLHRRLIKSGQMIN